MWGSSGQARPRIRYAETRDGWRVALYHYANPNALPSQSPVVVCHGLGSNRMNVDAPGRYSLARFIHSKGFDVWVVELRGAGKSHRASMVPSRRKITYDWNFDDYVHHDVPAALRLIRDETGKDDVHWVGHSMGGMVGYAFLTVAAQHHLRSLVAIGSPAFSGMRSKYLDLLMPFKGVLKLTSRLPYRRSVALGAPLVMLARKHLALFANPENMDPWLMARLATVALSDVSTSLLAQFLDWYTTHDFRGWYGTHSYKSNLRDIRVPVYIIAGAGDQLTPPSDIRYIYDQLASVDKRFTLAGRDFGFEVDYGHVDLVLGRHAPREIFPKVTDWLAAH